MRPDFIIGDGLLTLETLRRFAKEVNPVVALSAEARHAMARSRAVIDRRVQEDKPTYGVNTGFGALASRAIARKDLAELQRRLVVSNAAGVGPLSTVGDVRCMMLLKVAALATASSGARPELADALIAFLNAGITPCVPSQGSVGASGDLAPLAHIGAALIGVGQVHYQDRRLDVSEAMRLAGLEPLTLAPKEGLALVNGTQATTAFAASGLFAAETAFFTALVAGMLTLKAVLGHEQAFDARLHAARRQPGQIKVAAICRSLLEGSTVRGAEHRKNVEQDPYCIRCIPQVMGACLDQLERCGTVIETELNGWTDNPMVDPDSGEILYGGNFHAEPIGLAADGIALAIAETGSMSERRIALLTDQSFSKLPAFLTRGAGLDCGFMVPHVTAAALASENKSLSHPATVDSIPTSANQEDFVSMATFAARRLLGMAENAATIVAIELLAAAQGLEFRRPAKVGPHLDGAYRLIRSHVPAFDQDRFFAPEIERAKHLVISGAFLEFCPRPG